jgi:hypothetical protein
MREEVFVMPKDENSGHREEWLRRKERDGAVNQKVVPGVPPDLANSIDENGSLVTVPPADWIICFVPGLQAQWWHRFVLSKHKHVFAMRPTSSGSWILVEPWWTRLMVTVLPPADAVRYLRWGAMGNILRVREKVPGRASQLRGWFNCAVLTAFILGRRTWTWTPHGLFRRLMKEEGTRSEEVQGLLVEQFSRVVKQRSDDALAISIDQTSMSFEELLTIIARNMIEAMLTPSILEIYYTAVLEADRYPDATRVYSREGPEQAVAVLTRMFRKASEDGDITLADCEAGAHRFVAMLHGDIRLQALLQVGKLPTPAEMDIRARATVSTFLNGVATRDRRNASCGGREQ